MAIVGGGAEQIGFAGDEDRPERLVTQIRDMVTQFEDLVDHVAEERNLRRAVVRSRLTCSAMLLVDQNHLWIIAEPTMGIPTRTFAYLPKAQFSVEDTQASGVCDFGFQDPFTIRFERQLLDQPQEERAPALQQTAEQWVDEELRRVTTLSQLISLNPLFGQPAFRQDPQLCFVIMPFDQELTDIYQTFVKPTVEEQNLVCRRADDIRTNRAIMDNIWKSICEARLVIADLTMGNANVFYELGIAHTVGKETILISQRNEHRRPFDVLHLRTIIYENTAVGGERLREELRQSLTDLLEPVIVRVTRLLRPRPLLRDCGFRMDKQLGAGFCAFLLFVCFLGFFQAWSGGRGGGIVVSRSRS